MRVQVNKADAKEVSRISKEYGIKKDLVSFLLGRGYNEELINLLVNNKDIEYNMEYNLTNISESADLIKQYIDNNKNIYIFGDYDSDGINATYILSSTLLSFTDNVYTYIPERNEGYGLSEEFCDAVIKYNTEALVITVDNGINTRALVSYLKKNNINTIITDHHKPIMNSVPEDCYIIDAHLNDKDDENALGFCGAVVAYKLAHYLLNVTYNKEYGDGREYLPHAAIATINDMMPVTPENILIVAKGIGMMNKGDYLTPGIEYYSDYKGYKITPKDISFEFGPQINSCGRMGNVNVAFDYMFSDEDTVEDLYIKMNDLNSERKKLSEELTEKAYNSIFKTSDTNDLVTSPMYSIVAYIPNAVGIVGVVASSLSRKFNGITTIILTDTDDKNILTGSARSEQVNLPLLFSAEESEGNVITFGGHMEAAGITIKKDKLDALRESIEERLRLEAESSSGTEKERTLTVDKKIKTKDINSRTVEKYNDILYFNDLKSPMFYIEDAHISDYHLSSNNANNICFHFTDENGKEKKAWCWKFTDTYKALGEPEHVNVAFTLEKFNSMLVMDIAYMEEVE